MFRAIKTSVWSDPKFKALATRERLAFLYLITCPHAHLCGLFHLPELYMAHESGLSGRPLRETLERLERDQFIVRDQTRDLVWVRQMFKHQRTSSSHDQMAAKHLSTLHDSPLIDAFLELYPDVLEHMKTRKGNAPVGEAVRGAVIAQQSDHSGAVLGEGEGEEQSVAPSAPTPSDFQAVWNENRGCLGEFRSLNDGRRRKIRAALKEEPDLELWATAIRMKARDPFWQAKGLTVDTLTSADKRAGYLDAARNGTVAGASAAPVPGEEGREW